jgi:hypothetical protein
MTILNIVPECFVDTKIAEILGQVKKYNHQHGCGDVANELKNKLQDSIALGIIDEDKNKGPQAKYFSEFETIAEENNLILKKIKNKKHYLILICPEVEKWLLNDSQKINIDPGSEPYNLPRELKGFVQKTKLQNIEKNEGFKRFIKDLVKEKAPSITTLKKWIELFNANQLDDLRQT